MQKNKKKASVMLEAIRTKVTLIASSMTMYKSLKHSQRSIKKIDDKPNVLFTNWAKIGHRLDTINAWSAKCMTTI